MLNEETKQQAAPFNPAYNTPEQMQNPYLASLQAQKEPYRYSPVPQSECPSLCSFPALDQNGMPWPEELFRVIEQVPFYQDRQEQVKLETPEKAVEAGSGLKLSSKAFIPKDSKKGPEKKVSSKPEAKSGAQEISAADLYAKIEPEAKPQGAPVTDLTRTLYSSLSLPSEQKSQSKLSSVEPLELTHRDLVAGPPLQFGKDEFEEDESSEPRDTFPLLLPLAFADYKSDLKARVQLLEAVKESVSGILTEGEDSVEKVSQKLLDFQRTKLVSILKSKAFFEFMVHKLSAV